MKIRLNLTKKLLVKKLKPKDTFLYEDKAFTVSEIIIDDQFTRLSTKYNKHFYIQTECGGQFSLDGDLEIDVYEGN